MSIKYIDGGSVFDTGLQWIIHPVNIPEEEKEQWSRGFQERFPGDELSKYYHQLVNGTQYKVGNLGMWTDDDTNMYILFFPVKELWEDNGTLTDVEVGIARFRSFIKDWDIQGVAFPKLGADIELIDWEREVKPLFEKYLGDLNVEVEVYV